MSNEDIITNIINSFHEKNNSHAFLLVTNNIDQCYKDVMNMIKQLNCKNGTIDDCNICHTIDVGTNPDIITVKPVKREIETNEIVNIIDKFSTQPLISNYSMYVICEADLLNTSSANKLLKFLEEPEDGIVGFFITTRLSSMLPTITSRCEIINIRYGSNSVLDLLNISEEEYDKYFNNVKHILGVLDNNKRYERLVTTKEFAKYEREDILKIFKIIYRIYVIKFENLANNEYNNLECAEQLLDLVTCEDISVITNRIKLLEEFVNDFSYNVNKELFINKLYMMWE